MMDWTEIDYGGMPFWAADFCGGVMVSFGRPVTIHGGNPKPEDLNYIPGWRVEWPPELDGPALRRRDQKKMTFNIMAVEE
jgi:hypothetical protein